MIGRRVTCYDGDGVVTGWEPCGAGMCDARVEFAGGRVVWYASSALKPIDGEGPLPNRQAACASERHVALRQLRKIRANHVRNFGTPWPGCEFGKTILGQAIDGAIAEVVMALYFTTYEAAVQEAQERADCEGADWGLESNEYPPGSGRKHYSVFRLPPRSQRFGHELRCEVRSPSDLKRCLPGHGPAK